MRHEREVVAVGVNEATGRARYQASCSCGWRHAQANNREVHARHAWTRHLREAKARRYVERDDDAVPRA